MDFRVCVSQLAYHWNIHKKTITNNQLHTNKKKNDIYYIYLELVHHYIQHDQTYSDWDNHIAKYMSNNIGSSRSNTISLSHFWHQLSRMPYHMYAICIRSWVYQNDNTINKLSSCISVFYSYIYQLNSHINISTVLWLNAHTDKCNKLQYY